MRVTKSASFAGNVYIQPARSSGGGGGNSIIVQNNGSSIGSFTAVNTTNTGFNATASGSTADFTLNLPLAIGSGTTATSTGALAIGVSCLAGGNNSVALGNGSTASGNTAIAIGLNCVASGPRSIAMGDNSRATANGAMAFGGSQAFGVFSFAGGLGSLASGDQSTAFGDGCTAIAPGSFVVGTNNSNSITANNAASLGLSAFSSNKAQISNAGGQFNIGVSGSVDQTGSVPYYGQTPGVAINENVELLIAFSERIVLTPGYGYLILVEAICSGIDVTTAQVARALIRKFCVTMTSGGTVTIVGSGTPESFGDVLAGNYDITASVSGTDLILTFSTGAGTQAAVNVHANGRVIQAVSGP